MNEEDLKKQGVQDFFYLSCIFFPQRIRGLKIQKAIILEPVTPVTQRMPRESGAKLKYAFLFIYFVS